MRLVTSVVQFVVPLITWATGGLLLRSSTPVVRVSSGELRGIVLYDVRAGYEYYSYLGIPYATVKQRFQAAKPISPWKGIFDASDGSIRCTQKKIRPLGLSSVIGNEDCLILNVHSPVKPDNLNTKLLPVMVFIHGGGFHEGSSSPRVYGPQYLLRHDVILITINYRLDKLGFLCLGIKEAPGNIGLKDQVEAFKWIKKNAKVFGGDPDNITIFGESAGSVSVMYHLISPMSKGLFNRAIMQSGSAISPWGLQFEPLKVATALAKQMGFKTNDPEKLLKIFMSKTAEELQSTVIPRSKGDIKQSENIFVPCVEKEFSGSQAFLTDPPYKILSNGLYTKVPMIVGYNSEEGYYFVGEENATTIENMNFYSALPRDLEFSSKEEAKQTADKIQQRYIGDGKINRNNLVKFEGEVGISYPMTTSIDLILKTSDKPIFTYKFSYAGLLNLAKLRAGFMTFPGASHADDLFYMFKPRLTSINGFIETEIINRMTTMWTNFAKFGNPTPQTTPLLPVRWHPTSREDPHLFVINDEFSTESLWKTRTMKFWNQTYFTYRRKNVK